MYLFPLGKRILAIRAVSSGISGNFWGCRDIAFLLLFSTFLFTSYCSSPQYPSFSLSLSIPLANGVLKLVTQSEKWFVNQRKIILPQSKSVTHRLNCWKDKQTGGEQKRNVACL